MFCLVVQNSVGWKMNFKVPPNPNDCRILWFSAPFAPWDWSWRLGSGQGRGFVRSESLWTLSKALIIKGMHKLSTCTSDFSHSLLLNYYYYYFNRNSQGHLWKMPANTCGCAKGMGLFPRPALAHQLLVKGFFASVKCAFMTLPQHLIWFQSLVLASASEMQNLSAARVDVTSGCAFWLQMMQRFVFWINFDDILWGRFKSSSIVPGVI